ncbi:flagellar basal body-associated FliL family protein [Microvirga sp. 2TAF3]|uniref:flagellar basal body-associated FliL family protein n=1 Tax=Microvirga sp. 2TAF3 TaxID=3233014 RepID=UPI003F9D7204
MADKQVKALAGPAERGGVGINFRWLSTVVVLTLLAIGLGGGFGLLMISNIEKMVLAKHQAAAEANKTTTSPYSGDISLKRVAPVVTNLGGSQSDWVRIESSIVFKNTTTKNPDVLAAETRQDLLAYLRTVSVAQIQGPSGLLHLREDLNERVRLRSKGDIQELILETLVVQ